jgi:hypothetical protein
MTAVESTGTRSRIKEQYEKTLSFRKRTCAKKKMLLGGIYFLPFHLQKLKGGSAER